MKTLRYTDSEAISFPESIKQQNVAGSHYIVLLLGRHRKAKKRFYNRLKKSLGSSLKTVDLTSVISQKETTSVERIDHVFSALSSSETYLYLENGDSLGGVYTGFSYSVERYSTPQERHLLRAIQQSERVVFIDLDDPHTVTKSMGRLAQVAITFSEPGSFLEKLFWPLKQITLHGHQFESRRGAIT
ncbi:MAG: hypothetical protein ACNA78_01645 [Balneolaceae bacterium]